jgi:hypothetical protein
MGKGLICAWWHSSPGQIPPREFAAAWQLTRTVRGEILNLQTV